MDLVIDANILFAALIKENITSELLFKFTLYAPEFIFEEFIKYKNEIKKKTYGDEDDFNRLLDLFERNVILIPKEEIEPFIKQAEEISPDPKDVPYIALCLRQNCAFWSNDKNLNNEFHHSIEWWSKTTINMWNSVCSRTSMMLCIMPLVY